jgi:hypothetical protein
MKRSEIAMIILIASLSMLLTFTLAQSLLGDKIKRKASVEQAQAISEDLTDPAKRVFNKDAINPTVEVCIEGGQSAAPTTGSDCIGSVAEENAETSTSDTTTTDVSGASQSTSSEQSAQRTNN